MTPVSDRRLKSVLVVSYFYPPFQSVGALRVSKITKHLLQFGWRPIVLTVAHDDLPRTMELEIPAASIHRARSFDLNRLPKLLLGRRRVAERGYHLAHKGTFGRALAAIGTTYRAWLNFPDGQIGWYPFAVRKGLAIIGRERPHLIYSSALPPTSHIVASRLAAATGIPWIAEFRDPWTDNPNYSRPAILRSIERRLENRVMSSARAVVAVTPVRAAQIQARFQKPVATIPNGFDRDDYPTPVSLRKDFTITFTGMVYPGKQTARPLFQALSSLQKEGLVPPRFRVRLVGRNVEEIATEAVDVGVRDLVETVSQVDRRAALTMQLESTVLLLLLWMIGDDAWYPAKMFEYMGAGRPILAIGPSSNEAAKLLVERGVGAVAENPEALERILRHWFAQFRAGVPVSLGKEPRIDDFERQRQVASLAALFDSVVGIPGTP